MEYGVDRPTLEERSDETIARMSTGIGSKGFLNEESGKVSHTRVTSTAFFAVWVAACVASVYLASRGQSMAAASAKCDEVAFLAFVGTVAPTFLKRLVEGMFAKRFSEGAKDPA